MNDFKTYADSLLNVWNEAAPAARVGILLLATICIIAIGGVGYWSTQPSYVTLMTESDQQKIDKVMDALAAANITTKLSGAGGNLMVPKSDFAEARKIARGAGAVTIDSAEFGMGNAFGSPADRKRLATLQQQRRLAKTIEKMRVIDQADVHLSIPQRGPFERRDVVPSASVMLTLVPGSQLTDSQAYVIASTIANAVEDMEPEAVQISDRDGRSYTLPEEGMQQIGSQIDYTYSNERKLARKAQALLDKLLGPDNSRVEVALDLTFKSGSTTTTKYDPDGKVPSTENIVTEETKSTNPNPIGPAGVQSNRAGSGAAGSSRGTDSKTETLETKYLVSETVETRTDTTPIRNLMTVSVIVNSDAESMKAADGTPIEKSRVEELVKSAVGFRAGVDTITVELLPFPKLDDLEEIEVPYDWSQWTELVRNASLAIAAIVAFVIGFLMLRRIKPIPGSSESLQLGEEQSESIKQISDLMRNNPEALGQMLAAWAGEENTDDDQARRAA